MLIDVVDFGIPVVLGLIVMWRGVRRSLLSLPVRVLVALLAAWLVSTAASAYLVVEAQSFLDAIGQRLGLPIAIVLAGIGWLVNRALGSADRLESHQVTRVAKCRS